MATRKDVLELLHQAKEERCTKPKKVHWEWLCGAKAQRDARLSVLGKKVESAIEKLGLIPDKIAVTTLDRQERRYSYNAGVYVDVSKDRLLKSLQSEEKERDSVRDSAIKKIVQKYERLRRDVMLADFVGGKMPESLKKRVEAFVRHDGEFEEI